MKKNIFTLLALLVCAVGSAWADDPARVVWTFTSVASGTIGTADNTVTFTSTDASASTLTFKSGKDDCLYENSATIGGTAYTKYLKINGKGSATSRNMTFAAPYAKFKVTIVFAGTVNGTYTIDDNGKATNKTVATITPAVSSAVSSTTIQTTVGNTINLYDTGGKCYIYSVICEEVTSDMTASTFALTSDAEVEVAVNGTSTITYSNNAGTVTFESAKTSIAEVSSTGVITAKAPGKTTITVSDPGSSTVEGGSSTVTVLVPYPNPAKADSYVIDNTVYGFSNTANTKYYFTNGFTITNTAGKTYGNASSAIKFSANTAYTINVPSNVDLYYAVINARSNYKSDKDAANWGTVFGTDYSATNLPYSDEDMAEKEIDFGAKQTGGTLVFTPGGNQVQMIFNLYGIEYKAKYVVTYDKGEGTGSMDGAEVRAGTTFALPTPTFIAPEGKGFIGWLCSVDDVTYAAGADYTMTEAATTFTAQYASVAGTAIIKATPTATNTATVTGSIGGTAEVNLQDGGSTGGYKFGGANHRLAVTLASGTFKAGDIINIHMTKKADNGIMQIFDGTGSGKSLVYEENNQGAVGNNFFVLPAAVEGKTTLAVIRTNADDNHKWNAYVDYIEVIRPVALTEEATNYTPVAATDATVSLTRTLSASYYNTFCVPFDIDLTDTSSPLYGADVQEFDDVKGNILKFKAVTGTMEAGKPYIVKPAANVVNPVFNGVTVKAVDPATVSIANGEVSGSFQFKGTYNKVTLATDKTEQFLNTSEKFSFPSDAEHATMKGLRAYFIIPAAVIGSGAPELSISFDGGENGNDNTTVIDGLEYKTVEGGEYYNLAGQRIAQPTKGLYIVNGKKVIVK